MLKPCHWLVLQEMIVEQLEIHPQVVIMVLTLYSLDCTGSKFVLMTFEA